MTVVHPGDELATLRRRVERALERPLPRDDVRSLLEALAARAPADSAEATLAHRHLAELLLEESPWRASLHCRQVLRVCPDDDAAHALMGLAQALQGNYRMAVGAFRRAVAVAPSNAWYQHNLGHLLDVALDRASEALPHWQRAARAHPGQEEVGASLAHCLGRLHRCDEALEVVRALLRRHPAHRDLLALRGWLEEGAPARAPRSPRAPSTVPIACAASVIRTSLARLGRSVARIEAAVALWTADPRCTEPPDPAALAALDYLASRESGPRCTREAVAREHGVTLSVLAARCAKIRAR